MTDNARHAISMIRHQLDRIEKVLAIGDEAPTRITVARPMVQQVRASASDLGNAIEGILAERVLLFSKCWRDNSNEDHTGDEE